MDRAQDLRKTLKSVQEEADDTQIFEAQEDKPLADLVEPPTNAQGQTQVPVNQVG